MPNRNETHQTVTEPQPGDGVEISAARARQGYNGRVSRRMFWILVVSLVAAVALTFGYWASISGDLHEADTASGGPPFGQRVVDPEVASQFQAPEPAPKVPEYESAQGQGGG